MLTYSLPGSESIRYQDMLPCLQSLVLCFLKASELLSQNLVEVHGQGFDLVLYTLLDGFQVPLALGSLPRKVNIS